MHINSTANEGEVATQDEGSKCILWTGNISFILLGEDMEFLRFMKSLFNITLCVNVAIETGMINFI